MKKLILAAFVLVAALTVQAQTVTTPQYEEAIQVNGKAEKKVAPDEIWVAITIRDGDIKNLGVEGIEARMRREFAALGIDVAGALRVVGMANAPKKRNSVDTSRSYELKTGDTQTLNSVFEALGEMGVPDAHVTKVSHSRIDEFRRDVRVEAIKNAKENASVLAEAIGQSIGWAVWIFDGGYYETSPVPVMTRGYAKMEMAADTAYGVGAAEQGLDMQDITLTYNISAKFILRAR